mmetsp:Transcript_84313/g.139559  ORF Transcript_84313/g.139559 Transcript_84313/m.139559 type:complete len:396 (-) Transcript_84313:241-1428(-)
MGAAPTNSPCSIVCHSCDNDKGGGDANVAQISLKPVVNDPEANLAAWIRRRSGPECDFGEVFDEIFGGPSPVGEATFAKAFRERGAVFDAKLVFSRISKKGVVGQQEFEQWQDNLEAKELEGLRIFRDFLRKRFATPSAAYKAMGKGEGDVLTEVEFIAELRKLEFDEPKDPKDLFRYVDKDMSGEITFAEFKAAMRSVGAPRIRSPDQGMSRRTSRASTPSQGRSSQSSPRGGAPSAYRMRHRDSYGMAPGLAPPPRKVVHEDDTPTSDPTPKEVPKLAKRHSKDVPRDMRRDSKRNSHVAIPEDSDSSAVEKVKLEEPPRRKSSIKKDTMHSIPDPGAEGDDSLNPTDMTKRPSFNRRRSSGSIGSKEKKQLQEKPWAQTVGVPQAAPPPDPV